MNKNRFIKQFDKSNSFNHNNISIHFLFTTNLLSSIFFRYLIICDEGTMNITFFAKLVHVAFKKVVYTRFEL